jgi:SNF2 family DNA or RNA helicase
MQEEDFCEYCRNVLYSSPRGFICRNPHCFANIFVVGNFVKSYQLSEKGVGRIEDILENDIFLISFENEESCEVKKSDLTHSRFEKGDKVDTDYGMGMISSWNYTKSSNYLFYEVFLPDGIKTLKEISIRGIARTNPTELIKERKFDNLCNFYLRNKAVFFEVAQQSDEFVCIYNSRIDLHKHQVFTAHKVISEYNPRFILADEVGLGKTIEAGLVMKELKSRGLADRVLIITPANLVPQWEYEMKSRFNERFVLYNRHKEEELKSGENVWSQNDNILCSIDFAKRRTNDIAMEFWDLIIFDEAHHLRRRLVGKKINSTKNYKLAEALGERCNSMLLLTATPLQLDTFEFYSLIELLDPTIFETYDNFRKVLHLIRKKLLEPNLINQIMIRNRKRDVFVSMPKRVANIIKITLTSEEMEIYNEVSNYVKTEYNRALQENNNALGFVMVIFQKLLTSSKAALLASFRKRIKKLKEEPKKTIEFDQYEFEEETDDARERMMDELLSVSTNKREIETLEDLCKKLETIGKDSKAEELLSDINVILGKNTNEKVLIFTQFIGTQDYLYDILSKRYSVVKFNGKMPKEEKERAVKNFKESAQIMISTESGGEGRNFQFCHIMFNYDLPWNPMRVEQRIGRLDRIGQKKNVFIYNFTLEGTVEQRILNVLYERVKVFEETIGALEPILGDIEKEIKSMIMSQGADLETEVEKYERTLEEKIEEAKAIQQKLEDFVMDKTAFKWEIDQLLSKKPTISPEELMEFVELTMKSLGDKAIFREIRDKIYQLEFSLNFPTRHAKNRIYQGTFDPKLAKEDESLDFFAFGHEAINDLVDYFRGALTKPSAGIFTIEGHKQNKGVLFVYLVEFKGLTIKKKLIPIFVDKKCEYSEDVSNEVIKSDLRVMLEADSSEFEEIIGDIDNLKEKSEGVLMEQLEEEYRKEQEKNARIVEKELNRSEKLFKLKRNKLYDQIKKEINQLGRIRNFGDERQKRIIPAMEGKIRSLQNQIDNLEVKKEDKLKKLNEQKKVAYNYQLISAALMILNS